MRIYFDSVAMIYLEERVEPWLSRIQTKLSVPDVRVVYSDLVWMECRVKPIRLRDANLLADCDTVFANSELTSINFSVFDRATQIRANHRFRTPDSIHLAAAVNSGCDVFLTNDQQLAPFPDVRVEVI